MFIIGERINGMFRSVARAIQERDEGAIADLARRQVNAGANALDLNTGPTEGDPAEVMAWLVRTVQDAVDVPLSLDSPKPPVIASGLAAARGSCIINSTTGARDRLDATLPLAAEYDASLIALTIDERGIPRNAEARAVPTPRVYAGSARPSESRSGRPLRDTTSRAATDRSACSWRSR